MSILKLGGIAFGVDDLPEEIPLGGSQIVVTRQLPGGGLDVQPLGAYDEPITWEATFMYDDALGRAQAINDFRIAGKAINLTIGYLKQQVIITKFIYKFKNFYNVDYSIELQPLTTYNNTNLTVNGLLDTTAAATSGTSSIQSVSSSAAAAATPQKTYTIVSGDTLWSIAASQYGDGSQWTKIADANKDTIPDPNTIYPGTTIVIP